MEGFFLGGSLLAAFIAGSIALFAPCCIVFMFPAYLSAAVRNRRWRLVPLTFIFAAGLAIVLVPITLGVGILTRSLLSQHGLIYIVSGGLMLVLGGLAVTGKSWALPFMKGAPDIQRTDSAGVFALGMFSGAASACCAPVLAGVVTLSAVTPSLLHSTSLGLAYVFGMVFPLIVMTVLWDRLGLADRPAFRGKPVTWSFLGRTFATNTLNLVAAGMFALLGAAMVVVGVTGVEVAPAALSDVGSVIEDWIAPAVRILEPIPDAVVGLALIGLAVGAMALSGRRRSGSEDEDVMNLEEIEESCHVTDSRNA